MGENKRENAKLLRGKEDILSANYGGVGSQSMAPLKLRYMAIICIKSNTVLCDETYWKHDKMRKIPHRDTAKQWMLRKKWMSADELEKHSVFKEPHRDSGIIYYFNFSKEEGYGFVVATTEHYPERWVHDMLEELFDSNRSTYNRYASVGLRDIFVAQFANNLNSLRIKYEDFEHLEGHDLTGSITTAAKSEDAKDRKQRECKISGKVWLTLIFGLAVIAAIVAWLIIR